MRTQDSADSGFALFSRVEENVTAILPQRYSFAEGVMMPVGIDTAAAGLYQVLKLPFPSLEMDAKIQATTGQVLIVYGGSSVVGLTTTQLAVASGVRVLAIASRHNFELCKKAGASEVFDYHDADFVDDVVRAIGKDEKLIAIYDAISTSETYVLDFEILDRYDAARDDSETRNILLVVRPPPENAPRSLNVHFVYGLGEFSSPLWKEYVPRALENGQLKCLPPPLDVGTGLESLQRGLERVEEGVSGTRVVVELV